MNRENRKVTLSLAYILLGFAQACELSFYFLLYKYVSVEQIGLFSWANAVLVFFNIAVTLGIEPILVRNFSTVNIKLKDMTSAVLLLRVPIILLGGFLLQILYLNKILSYQAYLIVGSLGVLQVFVTTEAIYLSWLRAHQRQNIANTIGLLGSLGRLVSVFLFTIVLIHPNLLYIIWGMIGARVLSLAIASYMAYKYSHEYELAKSFADINIFKLIGELLRSGIVFSGISLLTVGQNRLDWLLISNFISEIALAPYSLANKAYETFQMLMGVSLNTMYPWLCQDRETGNIHRNLSLLIRGLIAAGTITAISGLFMLPSVVQLLFQNKYPGVQELIRILMLAASFITTTGIFYNILISKGFEKRVLKVSIIATVVQIIIDMFLIPRLGSLGAAIGMVSLATLTFIGITKIIVKEVLIPKLIIRRIFLFLILQLLLTGALINSPISVWMNSIIFIVIGCALGWVVLFEPYEKKWLYLQIQHSFGLSTRDKDLNFDN